MPGRVLLKAPMCRSLLQAQYLHRNTDMPANKGIGRNHKSGTGGSTDRTARRELSKVKLPGPAPTRSERSAGKRPAPPAEVRPQKALCQDADPRRQDIRDAAAELDAAVDVFEEATERLGNYQKKTSATMKRMDKLRAKPGTRSAAWTRIAGWRR